MADFRRAVPRFLVGILVLLPLAGCSLEPYPEIPRDAPSGGQTQEQLDATLATIPGLTVENAAGSKPNAKGNTGYGYDLTVDPGYEVADGPALVDFLVESAWSVRTGYMPNSAIRMSILGSPGDDFNVAIAATSAGWIPQDSQTIREVTSEGLSSANILLDKGGYKDEKYGMTANRERLGEWPGEAPEFPAGAIVQRTADQDSQENS